MAQLVAVTTETNCMLNIHLSTVFLIGYHTERKYNRIYPATRTELERASFASRRLGSMTLS